LILSVKPTTKRVREKWSADPAAAGAAWIRGGVDVEGGKARNTPPSHMPLSQRRSIFQIPNARNGINTDFKKVF
jgi:hypothetical protein